MVKKFLISEGPKKCFLAQKKFFRTLRNRNFFDHVLNSSKNYDFFHFSKLRRFFSLKDAIVDLKCKTKKLDIALYFYYQKILRVYNVSVRRNLIFRSGGRKFLMSILWRKKIWQYRFFYFSHNGHNFSEILIFSWDITKRNAYIQCVRRQKSFCDF